MDIRNLDIYNSLEAKVDAELEFIYDDNGNCVGKISKRTDKWKNVKTNKTSHGMDNLALITGRTNDIIVVDIDKPKEGEFDGLELFEDKIGKLDDLHTIITKTPSGGFHIFFKYNNKLKNSTKLTYLNKKYSIDIRSEGGIIYEGKHYELYKHIDGFFDLPELPENFIDLFKVDKEITKYENKYSCDGLYTRDGIELILNNLKNDYYENYQEWLIVLITLKNMGCDISLAKEFSMKSEKYNERQLINQWDILEKRDTPSIGTLLYFFKESVSVDKYKEMIKNLKKIKTSIDESVITDFEACDLFKKIYGRFIKTTINDEVYICNPKNNIWYLTKKNSILVRNLIKDFNKYLLSNDKRYRLDKANVRATFLSDLMIELQDDNIQFNNDPFILPFENGILDLRTSAFTDAKPEDLIFTTTGYNYKIYDGGDMAFNSLKVKFPKEEELRFIIDVYSLALYGKNVNEYIYSLIGESGANGKTSDMENLDDVVGNFANRFPSSLLTGIRENAESGNPAILKFKNKRFAYCSEPDASRKININNIKELTGDRLSCRALFSNEQQKFRTGATIFVCSQAPLDLEKVDDGIKRRIITIPYEITFVDNPVKPNERKRIDYNEEDKDNLKYSMLNLLTSNFMNLYNRDLKLKVPQRFMNYKAEYLDDIDEIGNFLKENYEVIIGEKIRASLVIDNVRNNLRKAYPQEIKSKIKKVFNCEHVKKGDGNYYLNLSKRKSEVGEEYNEF